MEYFGWFIASLLSCLLSPLQITEYCSPSCLRWLKTHICAPVSCHSQIPTLNRNESLIPYSVTPICHFHWCLFHLPCPVSKVPHWVHGHICSPPLLNDFSPNSKSKSKRLWLFSSVSVSSFGPRSHLPFFLSSFTWSLLTFKTRSILKHLSLSLVWNSGRQAHCGWAVKFMRENVSFSAQK